MVSTPEASGITKQGMLGRKLVQSPRVAFRVAFRVAVEVAALVVTIAVVTIAVVTIACRQWIRTHDFKAICRKTFGNGK